VQPAGYPPPAFFRALGEPTRLAVVARLACAGRPLTVGEVADCCGVHLSGVSRHLGVLHRAGLVSVSRKGREAHYSLNREVLTRELRALADALEGCCR